MREQLWHLRVPSISDYRWFYQLMDFHELTTAWLQAIQIEQPAHALTRGVKPELHPPLGYLNSFTESDFESLLEELSAVEALQKLETMVWNVQAWTLSQLRPGSKNGQTDALQLLLEQASWKQGRAFAEKRWQTLCAKSENDPRMILLALQESPFSGTPQQSRLLTRRATATEIQVEMTSCPHTLSYPEIQSQKDTLCHLHHHWFRGFIFALNNRLKVTFERKESRCIQLWTFDHGPLNHRSLEH